VTWARRLRTVHFVASIFIGLPLVGWTVTGLCFAFVDYEAVGGTSDRAPAEELDGVLDATRAVKSARAHREPGARVTQVRARMLLGRVTYVVELAPPADAVLVDAATGQVRDAISPEEAGEIARHAFRGAVGIRDTQLVLGERDAPSVHEPAYRVVLDDPHHTEVFVKRRTGEIASWRNDSWRRFDALWSLHVFGFVDRESPAHWPLRVAATLAVLAALSGAGLLVAMLARRLRPGGPSPRRALFQDDDPA
jgi:uncharacterized iron-regulated membrane protein